MENEEQKGQSDFGKAYDSVHGDDGPKVAASPLVMSWTLPVVVGLLVVSLGALTYAMIARRSAGWTDLREVRVTSDEGYLYLLVGTAGTGEPDWSDSAIAVAIDTYDARRGETRLPAPIGATIGSGAEFLVTIQGPGRSRISVTPPYQPHARGNPVLSPEEPTGEFANLPFYPNAERYSRDGTYFPPVIIDRGVLRYGSLDPDSPRFHTLSDVSVGEGVIEIRIPWNLLNVTDPSMKRVIHSEKVRSRAPGEHEPMGTVITRGFRIYTVSFDPAAEKPRPKDQLPAPGRLAPLYQWPTWDTPRFKLEPKHGVELVRQTLQSIPDHPGGGSS